VVSAGVGSVVAGAVVVFVAELVPALSVAGPPPAAPTAIPAPNRRKPPTTSPIISAVWFGFCGCGVTGPGGWTFGCCGYC
jgi:hypothetical protein